MENSSLLLPFRIIKDEILYRYKLLKGEVDQQAVLRTNWETEKRTRTEFLRAICDRRTITNYLEIGCATGKNLAAMPIKNKVGVDPASGGTLKMTSDDFFKMVDRSYKFDLIFIDGLHTYQQVYNDLLNSISESNDNGIIVAHDFLPGNFRSQMVPRVSRVWNGDVWRVVFDIRRAGIPFKIINMDFGLLLLKKQFVDADIELGSAEITYREYVNFIEGDDSPLCSFEEALSWID